MSDEKLIEEIVENDVSLQHTGKMGAAAEMLWVVLANVSEGDWSKQTQEWQDAAAKWRDNYFAALIDSRQPVAANSRQVIIGSNKYRITFLPDDGVEVVFAGPVADAPKVAPACIFRVGCNYMELCGQRGYCTGGFADTPPPVKIRLAEDAPTGEPPVDDLRPVLIYNGLLIADDCDLLTDEAWLADALSHKDEDGEPLVRLVLSKWITGQDAIDYVRRRAASPPAGVVVPALYVASRVSRAPIWLSLRDQDKVPIISSWIDEAGDGETGDFGELWQRIQSEISRSSGLLFYANVDDAPWKGALIEVGMAIALNKPVGVVVVGDLESRTMRPVGSWLAHKNVTRYKTIGHAVKSMLAAKVTP